VCGPVGVCPHTRQACLLIAIATRTGVGFAPQRRVRRRHAGSHPRLNALPRQHFLQRVQEQQDVAFAAGMAHQADAPDLAFQLAKTAPDLDVELVEQRLPYPDVVDVRRDAHRGEHIESVALLRVKLQSHGGDACMKGAAHPGMPLDASFQTFFEDDVECFVQRVHHVDGRRVMVEPARCPVVRQQRQVEIPAWPFSLAGLQCRQCPVVGRERGQSRRHADALLSSRVADVDPPVVHRHLVSCQRRHRVHQKERLVLPRQSGYLRQRLKHPG
jgi:hypothetical protein